MTKTDAIIKDRELHSFEGSKGVENLAVLCAEVGYHDSTYFGQFSGGSIGNLIAFLEDNPGAVTAVVDFIRDHEDHYDDMTDYREDEDKDEDEGDDE